MPNARKIHKQPIPRLGGVAIWLSVTLAFILYVIISAHYPYGNGLSGILLGGSILFLLGFVDDLYDLKPQFKLIIQIGAAVLAFLLGVRIEILSNPMGEIVSLGILSLPITVVWLVGTTNAVNFIDGVDGLAGGVTTIMAVTLGVVALYSDQPASALIAVMLAGAMMGFLVFNFNPARIFMGDSGALFAGFVLAGLSVSGFVKSIALSILLPMLIFTVPIMDMSFSVIRRLLKGHNPMIADDEHIHHKLIKAGLSANRTSGVLYILCFAGGAIATFMVGAHGLYLVLVVLLALFMFVFSRLAKLREYKEMKSAER